MPDNNTNRLLKDLIEKLLNKNVNKRIITFDEIKSHPFFNYDKDTWNSIENLTYISPFIFRNTNNVLNVDRSNKYFTLKYFVDVR